MKQLIADFPKHLLHALEIGAKADLKKHTKPINSVLILGLGGSGIGGTIVSELTADEASLPIVVNKNYTIPAYVGEHTLVIACSYSGNTEETIMSMEEAVAKGAEVAIITSGGLALNKAKANNYNHIVIPGDNPPRSMLGYSLTQLYRLLNHYGVISDAYIKDIKAASALLEKESTALLLEANNLADTLFGKTPVIYSVAGNEGVAVRFRQQLNENSKMLCWHHVIPEMNHNELVGWAGAKEGLSVVIFRNPTDFERSQKRIEINKETIEKHTNSITEVWSKGNSPLERALYLIHIGDWTSYFLSEKNGVDILDIKVIEHLKDELSKF